MEDWHLLLNDPFIMAILSSIVATIIISICAAIIGEFFDFHPIIKFARRLKRKISQWKTKAFPISMTYTIRSTRFIISIDEWRKTASAIMQEISNSERIREDIDEIRYNVKMDAFNFQVKLVLIPTSSEEYKALTNPTREGEFTLTIDLQISTSYGMIQRALQASTSIIGEISNRFSVYIASKSKSQKFRFEIGTISLDMKRDVKPVDWISNKSDFVVHMDLIPQKRNQNLENVRIELKKKKAKIFLKTPYIHPKAIDIIKDLLLQYYL